MLIVRVKGGLGNQLFCYAAARRLSLANNIELVIDNTSGFARDELYKRTCNLDKFNISARVATSSERLEPFDRFRRALLKYQARSVRYDLRKYIEQELEDFDERLLFRKIRSVTYIDGLWQSEFYFSDIINVIRSDLEIKEPTDKKNIYLAAKILSYSNNVALHIRNFGNSRDNKLSDGYYKKAILWAMSNINNPHFYVFTDDINYALKQIDFEPSDYTMVDNNNIGDSSYADLWLMTKCSHYIIANSTFSWWAAWLGSVERSVVIAPDGRRFSKENFWNTKGLLPKFWIKM